MQYILLLLCLFELICVPAVFLHMSLTAVTAIYLVLVIGMTGYLIYAKRIVFHKLEFPKSIAVSPVCIVVLMSIIYQLFLVLFYQHNDADDAWYIGTAVTACQTDTLFQFSSYTGMTWDMIAARDYILSPFPIYLAMWSKLLHIHPAILAHNVYPVLMVIWAYVIYAKIGKCLFENKQEREYFLLFICVLYLFGYYSTRTTGTFLLFRSWQGKSTFCAIMIPMLFYWYLRLLRENGGFGKDKKWFKDEAFVGILLTNLAATITSFSAVLFMPMLTGALAVTFAIAKKKIQIPIAMCLTLIPNVILVALYVFAF